MTSQALPMASRVGAIRVMVVDDSAVVRGLISRMLRADPDLEVVSTAANGAMALSDLRRRQTDVVVLDIEMPVMDGLAALPRILEEHPDIKVIMVSSLTRRNAEISLRSLQMGASDYVPKPEAGLVAADDFSRELIAKIKALGGPRFRAAAPRPAMVTPAAAAPSRGSVADYPATVRPPRTHRAKPSVIAIGSSTGGPPALLSLFAGLKGSIQLPILLTQHMPATFTALLAEQLTKVGERPCAEAIDGQPVLPGRCYVAPGGWHMIVERDGVQPVLRLNQDPPENFCRPAVDPMLRSVASVYGATALAVILTGMGSDGAKGCAAIADAGGRFIAQDEATSVVWGMPGAAAATGRAEEILPLSEIAPWICRAVSVTI